MFIIRAVFWLSIVLLLIPGEPGKEGPSFGVGAIDALLAARGVVADFAGICDRQPDVCVHGGAALQALGSRAWQSASGLITRFDGGEASASPASGTLNPADAMPAWQKPATSSGKA